MQSQACIAVMTDSLSKIFGSTARLKLLRLFLFNPAHSFTAIEAAERAQVSPSSARRELEALVQSGLLHRNRRGKQIRFDIQADFPYLLSLQNLLLNVSGRAEEVLSRLRPTGVMKLIIISGIFVGEWGANVDLLVVGDKIKERAFRNQIKKLEAEIGKEIRYTLLSSADFLYRLNMSDKLMRDVFDFPHRIVFDKFDIGLK
jgi:hypothetical protein